MNELCLRVVDWKDLLDNDGLKKNTGNRHVQFTCDCVGMASLFTIRGDALPWGEIQLEEKFYEEAN